MRLLFGLVLPPTSVVGAAILMANTEPAKLATQVAGALVLVAAIGFFLLKREMKRILDAVDRMPEKEWFGRIAEGVEEHKRLLEDLGHRVGVLESRRRRD